MSVAVLISTYNGDKYIGQQLESIINQSYKDIKIYIRDDGSKDNTIKILREFQEKYNNIVVYEGENLGYCKSFMTLLLQSPKSDYYAFCDQDDYWHKEKIAEAVNKLKEYDSKPALYYSEVNVVNEKLEFLYKTNYKGIDTLGSSFNTTPVIGCTSVINNALKEFLLENGIPDDCVSHDMYLYRVCLLIDGIVIHDKGAYISYRQHGDNEVGITKSVIKKLKVYERYKNNRNKMAKDFLKLYSKRMTEKNKKTIMKIANFYNHQIINRITLVCDRRFKAKKFKSDIKFIYDVFWGKI